MADSYILILSYTSSMISLLIFKLFRMSSFLTRSSLATPAMRLQTTHFEYSQTSVQLLC